MSEDIERASWNGLEELRGELERWLARRCRDAHEVDDVVQETLLRAARFRPKLQNEASLAPWAGRIARNVLADQRRLRATRPEQPAGELVMEAAAGCDVPDADVGPSDPPLAVGAWEVRESEALACMEQALAEIRPPDREVLRSYYIERAGADAVAAAQGIPPRLLKLRLFRARRRLLAALRRRVALGSGVDPVHTGALL